MQVRGARDPSVDAENHRILVLTWPSSSSNHGISSLQAPQEVAEKVAATAGPP